METSNQIVLSATDLHYWRKEKSRRVIEYLASALTCRQTPKSREMIGHAIRDAAKLFMSKLEFEAGMEFHELPDEIRDSVMRSPQNAKELLDEMVAKRLPDAKT